jgi:hypothetical protein
MLSRANSGTRALRVDRVVESYLDVTRLDSVDRPRKPDIRGRLATLVTTLAVATPIHGAGDAQDVRATATSANRMVTEADCTASSLVATIAAAAVGEPVRSVTLQVAVGRRHRRGTRERTFKRPPIRHKVDQAGGTFNTDSAARVAAKLTSLMRAISSTTDVTYAESTKLLSLPSRLEREPSKPACKSATPS